MNLNISYSNKDAAKAAFRAAGIPLTWNATDKQWQTTASELPASLAQYTPSAVPTPSASTARFYLCQCGTFTPHGEFPFRVEAAFASKEDARQYILSGRWLNGWTGSEKSAFADCAWIVVARAAIHVGKHIPAHAVSAYNKLTDSKDKEILAVVMAAINN